MPVLSFDTYGKTSVRLLQVMRNGQRHNVTELNLSILFEGDFEASYKDGDNSEVLPTDTIKNTVYVIARQKPVLSIEAFAADLADHFLGRVTRLTRVVIEISQRPWTRIEDHDAAFVQTGTECRIAHLVVSRQQRLLTSGIRNLQILKTNNSAFAGFLRDEFTTLPETVDRLLNTVLDAEWTYTGSEVEFNRLYAALRSSLLDCFAHHHSLSVQHTLFAMGEDILNKFAAVDSIHLTMPNKHCLLADLARFSLDNPNQIFIPTDEPSGLIEARITR